MSGGAGDHNMAVSLAGQHTGYVNDTTNQPVMRLDNDTIFFALGTTVPSDAATGYATGCIFIHTDGGNGTALYVNEGTSASADFNAITVA